MPSSGQPQRRRRHHHHHHHHNNSGGGRSQTRTSEVEPGAVEPGTICDVSEESVRFSGSGHVTNGTEMNGHGRNKTSKAPAAAEVTSLAQLSNYRPNNGHAYCGQVWRLAKGFNENDEALINRKLPKELLLRIFSHLDVVSLCRCAQVSRDWNVLALDGSNWQYVDLFQFQIDIEGIVVENLARRCGGFLRQLSLRGCQAVGDSALATFSQYCNNIEHLNLKYCKKISDRTGQSLALHCYKLRYLDVSSCSAVTDIALHALAQGCRNLVHIDISWCDMVTSNGVRSLAENCNKLQVFISKGCLISDDALAHLAQHCAQLCKVNVQGCRNVQDEGVVRLAESCRDLSYLCVSNCTNLTDAVLLALAQNCPRLSAFECAGVSQFTDTGFGALARSCPLLEKLDLEECVLITDITLSALSACCPRLESVSLSHCELVTDEGIRQLGLAPCASEHLNVLELDNLPLITDASLDHLVSCHNLQRIELYDCQLITRAGIRRLRGHLQNIKVHAYFAPVTPPPSQGGTRQRYCRCCAIL